MVVETVMQNGAEKSRCLRRSAVIVSALTAIASVASFGVSQAAEGVKLPGPIGGADMSSALLPAPGVYAGFGIVAPRFTDFYTANGSAVKASQGGESLNLASTIVYGDFLGGRVASSMVVAYAQNAVEVDGLRPYASDSGIGDTYIEPLFWSRLFSFGGPKNTDEKTPDHLSSPPIPYGLAVGLGVGFFLPTGVYNVNKPYNIGLDHYTMSPSLAFTYTTPSFLGFGDAIELSARAYYSYQWVNPADNYLTGNIVNVDFAATVRYRDYQFGLAGSYVDQVSDDTLYGATVRDGNRARAFQLGPVISRRFTLNERPWVISAKALLDVAGATGLGRDAIGTNVYVVRLGTKLF